MVSGKVCIESTGELLIGSDRISTRCHGASGCETPTDPRREPAPHGEPVVQDLRRPLIDREEDRTLRAVLVGMLREAEKR